MNKIIKFAIGVSWQRSGTIRSIYGR